MDNNQQAGCAALLVVVGGLAMLIAMLILGGTWRTDLAYAPAGDAGVSNVVEFTEKLNAPHWVFGLVQGKDPNIQEAVEKHLGEGKRLASLRVTTKHTFVDNLLMIVTLGIYTPTTVTIQGAVGSLAAAAPAPAPPPAALPDTGGR